MVMANGIAAFFEDLGQRAYEPLLASVTGSVRFDVTGGRSNHWLVVIKRGKVVVSRANTPADCTVRATESTVDGLTGGRINAMAALLRGLIDVDGDPELLVHFQRLFPAPAAPPGISSERSLARQRK
jgi:hypothetical protein